MENNSEVTKYTPATFEAIEIKMQEAGFKPEQVKREISFAVQHINKSLQLQKCTPLSLLTAVMNVSNIDLSLNPASKECYLIPRYNGVTKQMEAALEPSYVGLVKLLTDTGSVTSMVCQLVYSNDIFKIDLADNRNPVKHEIDPTKKRGDKLGCYALATLPDGTRQVEWMTMEEIYAIRDRSETYKAYKEGKIKSCTWISDDGEMSRKTVIKRIYKYLPRTERMATIDNAIQLDNSDYMASDDQIDYIHSLLQTSSLDQRQRDAIEMETTVMNPQRASDVIQNLKENQLDPVQHRGSYSQKELNTNLRERE